jgi:hypothetical protein
MEHAWRWVSARADGTDRYGLLGFDVPRQYRRVAPANAMKDI